MQQPSTTHENGPEVLNPHDQDLGITFETAVLLRAGHPVLRLDQVEGKAPLPQQDHQLVSKPTHAQQQENHNQTVNNQFLHDKVTYRQEARVPSLSETGPYYAFLHDYEPDGPYPPESE